MTKPLFYITEFISIRINSTQKKCYIINIPAANIQWTTKGRAHSCVFLRYIFFTHFTILHLSYRTLVHGATASDPKWLCCGTVQPITHTRCHTFSNVAQALIKSSLFHPLNLGMGFNFHLCIDLLSFSF